MGWPTRPARARVVPIGRVGNPSYTGEGWQLSPYEDGLAILLPGYSSVVQDAMPTCSIASPGLAFLGVLSCGSRQAPRAPADNARLIEGRTGRS